MRCIRCGLTPHPSAIGSCPVSICGAGPFCTDCQKSHWDRVHDISQVTYVAPPLGQNAACTYCGGALWVCRGSHTVA